MIQTLSHPSLDDPNRRGFATLWVRALVAGLVIGVVVPWIVLIVAAALFFPSMAVLGFLMVLAGTTAIMGLFLSSLALAVQIVVFELTLRATRLLAPMMRLSADTRARFWFWASMAAFIGAAPTLAMMGLALVEWYSGSDLRDRPFLDLTLECVPWAAQFALMTMLAGLSVTTFRGRRLLRLGGVPDPLGAL